MLHLLVGVMQLLFQVLVFVPHLSNQLLFLVLRVLHIVHTTLTLILDLLLKSADVRHQGLMFVIRRFIALQTGQLLHHFDDLLLLAFVQSLQSRRLALSLTLLQRQLLDLFLLLRQIRLQLLHVSLGA
jgi:hypothetical protein